MEDALSQITKDYQGSFLLFRGNGRPHYKYNAELNGVHIEHVSALPTALEFSRMVHIARPVLMSPPISDDPFAPRPLLRVSDLWSDSYLARKTRGHRISIAVTPDGHADALVMAPDGKVYFAEPWTGSMTMEDFLASIDLETPTGEVRYLQSQNGNLYNASVGWVDPGNELCPEFAELCRSDVPVEIPWVRDALGHGVDAVNLWIGDHRSVTSLHSDPYENIYTVVRGEKYFTLFPPTEGWLLDERLYPHATYTRPNPDSPLVLTPSDPTTHRPVRWASCDPDKPPPGTMPIRVTVREGETLYLPAGWYHHVRQAGRGGGRGKCIAVNWWYDAEMRGMQWVWLSFLREGRRLARLSHNEDDDEIQIVEQHE